MAKTVIPMKAIISFKDDGSFDDCILQYQLKSDNGSVDLGSRSISVVSVINVPAINGMISDAADFVTTQENS